MPITQPSKPSSEPVIQILKAVNDPAGFKKRVKEIDEAIEKLDEAKKAYDTAKTVAKTIDEANAYDLACRDTMRELEAKRKKTDASKKVGLDTREASIRRHEGAHQIVVAEHNEANLQIRKELANQVEDLEAREALLERGNRQLVQENYALKQAQDALCERRDRLALALKD